MNAHGIQRNCSRIVLYSSNKNAGLGVQHIYHMQGLEQLKFFLYLVRNQSSTSKLIEISMRYTQLEIGVNTCFLQLKYSKYSHYSTKTWITGIWQFLDSCNADIIKAETWFPPLPRENDEYFMNIIYQSNLQSDDFPF